MCRSQSYLEGDERKFHPVEPKIGGIIRILYQVFRILLAMRDHQFKMEVESIKPYIGRTAQLSHQNCFEKVKLLPIFLIKDTVKIS